MLKSLKIKHIWKVYTTFHRQSVCEGQHQSFCSSSVSFEIGNSSEVLYRMGTWRSSLICCLATGAWMRSCPSSIKEQDRPDRSRWSGRSIRRAKPIREEAEEEKEAQEEEEEQDWLSSAPACFMATTARLLPSSLTVISVGAYPRASRVTRRSPLPSVLCSSELGPSVCGSFASFSLEDRRHNHSVQYGFNFTTEGLGMLATEDIGKNGSQSGSTLRDNLVLMWKPFLFKDFFDWTIFKKWQTFSLKLQKVSPL